MKHYTIMATDWDYAYPEEIKNYQKKGLCLPSMIKEVLDHCGSLFPYITSKTNAINHLKAIKKQFPFVRFGLYEGQTWGSLELVKEF